MKLISPLLLGGSFNEKVSIAVMALYSAGILAVVPFLFYLELHGVKIFEFTFAILKTHRILFAWTVIGLPIFVFFIYLAGTFLLVTLFGFILVYRPGQSFWQVRLAAQHASLYYRLIGLMGVFYIIDLCVSLKMGAATFSAGSSVRLCNGLFCLGTAYYGLIAAKVHRNVDHVAALALRRAKVIGERDRLYASYQNFDSSIAKNPDRGAFIAGVLVDRVAALRFDGRGWKSIIILFNDIKGIGIFRYGGDIYLGIANTTGQFIRITLDVTRMTCDPIQFIRAILDQIDLKAVSSMSTHSRRRVVGVSGGAVVNPSGRSEMIGQSIDDRAIEVSNPFVAQLSAVSPLEFKRVLEL